MKYIDSNKFSISVNRIAGATELGSNGKVQSKVTVYKGESELTPVASDPGESQFQLTIMKTTGCLAAIKDLNTVYATDLSEQKGTIVLTVNVEGKTNFVKNINLYKSVAMDEVATLGTRLKIAEQKITTEAITNTLKSEFYTKDQVRSQMTEVNQTLTQWGVKINENGNEISTLKIAQENFEIKIADKADATNIIAMINASKEGLTISADKINISGYVTFSNLSTSGKTIINADNITTGHISGDRIKGGVISATDEINFVGGARIFGNEGAFGAGLEISASSYKFGGASMGYMTGSWTIGKGLDIETGDLTMSGPTSTIDCYAIDATGVSCTALYSAGTIVADGAVTLNGNLSVYGAARFNDVIYGPSNIALANEYLYAPNGYKYRDYLRLGTHLIQSDPNGLLITNTSGNYLSIVASRAELTEDLVCRDVWASSKVYAANVALTSDERLKTDIRYVDNGIQTIGENGLMSPNVNITTKDMHAFIEVLPLASYRMKEEVASDIDYTYYGFIAQDVLYSKVGSELIEYGEVVVKNVEYDRKGRPHISYSKEERLRYSENKFIAFLAGALKEEIYQRKELERKMGELYEIVEEISNL